MKRTRAGVPAQGVGRGKLTAPRKTQTRSPAHSVGGDCLPELTSGGAPAEGQTPTVPDVAIRAWSAKGSHHRNSQHHILSTHGSWSEKDVC